MEKNTTDILSAETIAEFYCVQFPREAKNVSFVFPASEASILFSKFMLCFSLQDNVFINYIAEILKMLCPKM